MDSEFGVDPPYVGVNGMRGDAQFDRCGISRQAGDKAPHDLALLARKRFANSVPHLQCGMPDLCRPLFLSHLSIRSAARQSDTNRGYEKTSLTYFLGGPEIALREYEERKRMTRLSAKYRSRKFLRFPRTTALQHCKLFLPRSTLRCGDRGGYPPMTVLLSRYRHSFHFQFAV